MRIGLTVDALAPRRTGIGRYTLELARGLRASESVHDLSYFRFGEWIANPEDFVQEEVVRRLRWPRKLRPYISRRGFRGRLIHGTNFFLPDDAEHGIITVHDLSVLLHPETHPAERIRHFESDFQRSLERATHIISDSNAVRDELIAHLGVSPERITSVHLGISSEFRKVTPAEVAAFKQELFGDPSQPYILCVATIEPRKRIEQAVRAHAEAVERGKISMPLVIAGASGWNNEGIAELIDRQQQAGHVKMLGWVAEASLPTLYGGADLFLYPSIYEGFGLPPVEAMACGTPVIVSNRSCLPEVTGGAAMYIDPDDIDGFAAAITRGVLDTQWRNAAIAQGRQVSARYTWDACVKKTVTVYENLWSNLR